TLDNPTPHLPFTFTDITLHTPPPTGPVQAHIDTATGQVTLLGADGEVFAHIAGVILRPAVLENPGLHTLTWTPASEPESQPDLTDWVLVGESSDALDEFCAPHPDLASVPTEDPVTTVLALDIPSPAESLTTDGLPALLHSLRSWLTGPGHPAGRLVVLTRGAVAAGEGERVSPAVAAARGLVRSAQSENPGRIVLVDTDGREESDRALRAAVASGEPEVALREGVVLVPRITRAVPPEPALPTGPEPWRLAPGAHRAPDDLTVVPWPGGAEPLGAGQVRIAVRAAGLNFRDVLIALGMVPERNVTMGAEGAGVVVETGPGVTDLAVGDRVMGYFDGAFGPRAVADRRLVARMPEGWSFAQAAAVPVVFLTAYYGLVDLGRVRPGEKVLIHAGAGGVGMAALQLARHLGAEVFATASPGKWGALRELGVAPERIANSRTTAFEAEFRAATGGTGMDVVLNSLTGEFIDASLRLLSVGGRFLEMGKTDVREKGRVEAEWPGVGYHVYDLTTLARTEPGVPGADPERMREILAEVLALFDRGVLEPLPLTVRDIRRAREAFRFLAQARNVGKVVLTVPAPLDPDGTVLITGGTGALGAEAARHLVREHGVRRLVLAGRRGPGAPGARELVAELAESGASATVVACDVAEREEVAALLAGLPVEHPLTAVVHTAGVLDDGIVTAMTDEALERVLRPKAVAARHLDELTRGMDLAEFVLYSSYAGVSGGPGQANYAAANSFLDALAHERAALGLPAVSLAWGLWERESGMTGHLGAADRERLARGGLVPLSTGRGMALFDEGRALAEPVVVATAFDEGALRERGEALPALLRDLVRAPARRPRPEPDAGAGAGAGQAGPEELRGRLAPLSAEDRTRMLMDLVRTHLSAVLGHSDPGAIGADRAFEQLGLDSLMGVELRNRLNLATGLRLPSTAVFDHPTAAELAVRLDSDLLPGERDGVPAGR
ncbi:SDR family NAD(P)-dependent oxidoreductase, partial [Streptomyces sp. NPDC004608]